MKLFPKLSLIMSAMLLGTILALSSLYYWSEQKEIRRDAQTEQQGVLQNLVHMAQESFLLNDDLLLVKYAGLLPKWNSAIVSASVTGLSGNIIANSEPERIGQVNNNAAPKPSYVLVLNGPVQIGGHPLGTATLCFSQQRLEEAIQTRLSNLRLRMTYLTLFSLILALTVSFILARSLTLPIQLLVEAAERIGHGKWQLELDALESRRDEIGHLSTAFHRMAGQLAELDQMKEDFVTAVTHELRSPLGAIESYLNTIDGEIKTGETADWPGYFKRMRNNVNRLTHFINDLLDVAALERGKTKIESKAVDLVWLTKDVLSLYESKVMEKQLVIEVKSAPQLPQAWVDSEKIEQVLSNLITNAIKFTAERGRIDIELKPLPANKQIRITITDTGVGIASADQDKIFNKFEQVPLARRTIKGPKGTGLGLAISREIIQLHGGQIGVESKLGEGSTFYFTVPIVLQGAIRDLALSKETV
jgi:signal transduction histidine kinase